MYEMKEWIIRGRVYVVLLLRLPPLRNPLVVENGLYSTNVLEGRKESRMD